jgi:3-hydroxymyristoyl/3-hydroxydecanoyl-(acyl carrier protein) dehydratase
MAAHFAAYSFVDRIDALDPGRAAHGTFAVPPTLRFSSCLVAEAVGQLAAWVAMDHIDYRGRPVAGIANETRFGADAHPGATLDLSVDIEQCDDEAVAYRGRATSRGQTLVELFDCLGPMLPTAQFDDPAALRARFALLRGEGAAPARFGGVTLPPLADVATGMTGETATLRARFEVPQDAPFFHDHFPRKPVFPATLLLDLLIGQALELARAAPWSAGAVVPRRVTHVKMRSFIVPGQQLDLTVALQAPAGGRARATLQAATDGRTVGGARLELHVPAMAAAQQ